MAKDAPQLRRVLGMSGLVLFGLAYMVPLAVFDTFGIVTNMTSGHLPAAYIVTTIAMLFTAFSYGQMSRAIPKSGSAYAYARSAFGGEVGFLAGWGLMLDYVLLPMLDAMVISIYLHASFPDIPAGVFIVAVLALSTVLNVIGIRLLVKANFILIAVQVVFLITFFALGLRAVAVGEAPNLLAPLMSPAMQGSEIMGGAAILCLAFLGFDAVSTLAEEAKDPKKQVPKAIMLVTLCGGFIFTATAYIASISFPNWQDFVDIESAGLEVMQHVGGMLFGAFFVAAYCAGSFASAMTSQASVSRILYSMGRDGVLPRKIFGSLSERFRTPLLGIVLVGAIGLLGIWLDLDTLSSMISFGALFAFSMVNLATIKHFVIDKRQRRPLDLLRYGLVPAVGFGLTLWLWTSLSGLTFVIGLSWLVLGAIQLAYITGGFKRRPPELDPYADVESLILDDDPDASSALSPETNVEEDREKIMK